MMTGDRKDNATQGHDDTKRLQSDADTLAHFLDAARDTTPDLSEGLRARILADADACLVPRPHAKQRLMPWRNWFAGWAVPGLAGGAAIAVAGFWIGVTMPLPVLALDAPEWMESALSYMDLIALQLIGLDDPLLMEF